jgi:DNA-binding NtrC family response regulator
MSHWALEAISCSTFREARALLPDASLSLIFCEDRLADGTYHDLLRALSKPLRTRFVVISATPDVDDIYNEAMASGAFDVIASPCRRSDIQWMVIRAIQEETRRGGNRRHSRPAGKRADGPHSEGGNHAGAEAPERG